MKNIVKFAELVRRAGACSSAVAWIGDRDMRTAIAECPTWDWTEWALDTLIGRKGFPSKAEYDAFRAPLNADYEAKRAPLDADYEAKRAPLDADYRAKRDALDADYRAKRDALDADYRNAIKNWLLSQIGRESEVPPTVAE